MYLHRLTCTECGTTIAEETSDEPVQLKTSAPFVVIVHAMMVNPTVQHRRGIPCCSFACANGTARKEFDLMLNNEEATSSRSN